MARTTEPKTKKPAAGVNSYDAELAAFAAEYGSMEENAGGALPFVSFKGGRISFNGGEVPDGRFNVVVLDHVLENHFYLDAYDADNPSSPACFAFGRVDAEMAPHDNSSEPQCEGCRGCPMNEFGSADRGKGKACKNVRRLAIITEEDLDDIENATVAYMKVPVMSVKGWAGYVQQLANVMKVPPFAVITEVSIVPDAKSQFRVQFKLVEQITDKAQIKALIAKRESIQQEIVTPYQATEIEEKPAPRGRAKTAPRGRQAERDSNPPERPGRGSAKPAAKPAKPAPGKGGRKF